MEQMELRARLRARVVEEVILTERTYVADLHILCAQFCVPLRDRISASDHAKIFSNVEMLVGLHEQVSAALDAQGPLEVEAQTLGAVFLKYADFMRMYSTYCSNMDVSNETVRKLVKVPAFAEVLTMAGKSGSLRMLSLGDFLIKPIQRITKYPLLLRELIANTAPEHPDLRDIEAAKAKLESLLDKINAEKKANEAIQQNQNTLRSIQQQIDDLNINLTDNARRFVKKGVVTRVLDNEKQDLAYFLFDDLFLVCKARGQTKYQLKHSYSFNQCLIRTIKKSGFTHVEKKVHRRSKRLSTFLHAARPSNLGFASGDYLSHIPLFPLYYAALRDCFDLLNLDYKQKVHTYAVLPEDKDLVRYMQDAIYAQTLHIEHILKVKYGWFLDAQTDYVADLVFCYRLFCPPMEFLSIFETRYPNVDDGKEVLSHFIEGLESTDLEFEEIRTKLETMISMVQIPAMQSKMLRDMKRLTRGLIQSPAVDGFTSPLASPSSFRSPSSPFSGTLRALSPPPSHRRISCSAASPTLAPPPVTLDSDLPESLASSLTLTHVISNKDAWIKVSAEAQGITQRECDVFRRVRTQEILAGEGPNVDELLDLISWTTRWVSTKILSFDSLDKRADAISGFISLAAEFRRMNNFNGVMEIIRSLRSGPIERLKDSWLMLSPTDFGEWISLSELMASANNYYNYRQALKAVDFSSPCLPCILVILADITSIDIPEWSEGKINMEYVRQVSSLLREFRTHQKSCHAISTGIPELYSDLVLKEEDLEKLSITTYNETMTTPRSRTNSISFKTIRRKKAPLQASIFTRPVANDFSQADWDRIMAVGEVKTFQPGDVVVDIDVDEHPFKPLNFYYIKEGSVKATRTKGSMWYDVHAGDGIGVLSFLNTKSSIYVVALTPAVLKMANVPYVHQLLETDPDLAARFYKYVAMRINTALRMSMTQMSQKNPSRPSSAEKINYETLNSTSSGPNSGPNSSPTYDTNALNGASSPRSPNTPRSPNAPRSPRTPNPSPRVRGETVGGSSGSSASKNLVLNQNSESLLSEWFSLEDDEVVIKSYDCKYKRVNGRLFVTKYNLFFCGKSFGVQTKKQVPFSQVAYVKATKQLEVKQEVKLLKFIFKTQEEVNETEALIGSVFNKSSPHKKVKSVSKSALDTVMSPADWQLILTGTTNASFSAGSVIISEGVRHTRLCQILKGKCVITKKVIQNDVETTERIASRHAGEIFGEMSFLDPGSLASASVVADTDVEICILDFQYVTVLLSVYHHLGPTLYKYLALLLRNRLGELETKFDSK